MDSVQPLRISKTNTPSSSPGKMAMATSRPLSEIGSTERRRNSPSYNQATKKMIVSREASPYTENSSPPSFLKGSPRDFWQGKDPMSPSRFDSENVPERDTSPSAPKRRPSVERLMQASRVRNSNIFALESKDAYDPTSLPIVERPSANRMSQGFANNQFARFESIQKENTSPRRSVGHKRTESQTTLPLLSPTKAAANTPLPLSPEKQSSPSPTKSSMARISQFGLPQTAFDPENGTWSDGEDGAATPRALHRHAKSVTFHEDPPVINEYEQPTPEPSVTAASDREGSWDSDDFYDEDLSFDRGSSDAHGRDDSFDADLENADKTPVVLPEDWSRMSPEESRNELADREDDVFEDDHTRRDLPTRVASDGEARPLPPLPAFLRERRGSDSLTSAAERAAHLPRGLASPPKGASISKDDILKMTSQSALTLDDRLKLMGGLHEERPTSKSSQVTTTSHHEELKVTNLDTGESRELHVTEAEVTEDSIVGDLSEFTRAPPRISRESILRKVRNTKYDFEDEEDDVDESELGNTDYTGVTRPSIAELARMDPDQAVPSRENSRETSDHYGFAGDSVQDHGQDVKIKAEPRDEDDEGFDMSAIPAADIAPPRSPSRMDEYDRETSVIHHRGNRAPSEDEADDDTASRYSSEEPDAEGTLIEHMHHEEVVDDGKETLQDAMQLLTVKDYGETPMSSAKQGTGALDFMGLPTYLSAEDDFFGMKEYITPSPPTNADGNKSMDAMKNKPELQPVQTPSSREIGSSQAQPQPVYTEREVSPPESLNGSVLHYQSDSRPISPIEEQKDFQLPEQSPSAPPPRREDMIVPDRKSSIKTPGGKLKARPSATPADFEMMAEQRRLVSTEYPVPPIPAAFDEEKEADATTGAHVESGELKDEPSEPSEQFQKKRKSRKSGGRMDLSLDTSTFSIHEDEGGLGLNEEFERVIEGQKVGVPVFPPPLYARFDSGAHSASARLPSPFIPHARGAGANVYGRTQKGYLMRQNTKVVVATARNVSGGSDATATSKDDLQEPPMSPTTGEKRPSSRGTRSANSSPRKGSAEQFLKTEPWNGKMRRQSVRVASAQRNVQKYDIVPPLPGQESVVDIESRPGTATIEEEIEDGAERGRLFVKVVGVKDLDMPLPRNDRVYFQLTLDNGLHCVTTTSLELGTVAPIGQEFELVVLNDLEFQLTLTTKLPPPPAPPTPTSRPSSPNKTVKPQKSMAFSRFLSSPKKRAEKERLEREAAQAEERRYVEEEKRKRASQLPTAWDLLHELVNASDGSFARAYVNLKAHEKTCFGRQLTVDVPCYNEWALENDAAVVNSVRSKRGTNSGPVRRPPYVIGQLELQLMYIPKPRAATDEDMPKSMSAAVREMRKAGEVKECVFEGHLSQQGGDCIHWRRRFFRLQGPKLTAYHEHTHQKRAVINLTKASRLVDDKRTLTANPSPSKSGKGNRRKSAFGEEDEGYQYVEEGFRLRFANGETIDFYADSRESKEDWMRALSQVIGKADTSSKTATWTDLVLARERVDGTETPALPSSPVKASPMKSSPVKQNLPEIKDFGGVQQQQPQQNRPYAPQQRSQMPQLSSPRKPVPKSAPTSPAKSAYAPPPRSAAPPLPTAATAATRPRTPPMSARKGHRSRDAVKSMIF